MVSESPEGELSQISHSLSLTSRWSCFTSLSRLPASSIIERAAGRVNTILKHAHYAPLKLTHTFDMRALDRTCCSFTPSSVPHRWSSLLCNVLTGCRSQQTGPGLARCGPFTMTGVYCQISRVALDCVEWAFLRSFSVRLSVQNRMKICSSWKRKKKTVLPQTGWGKKKKEVKFFNRDLLFHFMSTEAAAQ